MNTRAACCTPIPLHLRFLSAQSTLTAHKTADAHARSILSYHFQGQPTKTTPKQSAFSRNLKDVE
jgi:hypothetical protein